MFSEKINDHLYLIDLKPAGVEKFISSYILKAKKTAIIETGPTNTVKNLLQGLKELNIDVENIDFVVVSHIHADHGGGVGTLLKNLPNAKLIVHPRGAPHIINPEKLWLQTQQVLGHIAEIYGQIAPVSGERIIPAFEGMTIDLGMDISLKVIETLGHASHHLCYYENYTNGIFSGDAAGIFLPQYNVIVPTTPAPFHLEMALNSIKKLIEIKPDRLYYTHFGYAENAVKKLQLYASQLKLWAEIVKECIEQNEPIETMEEKIMTEDSMVKQIANDIEKHPIMGRGMLKQNIQGFIEYFKRFSSNSKTHI
jgi:glyoxylase-like metal-dependent hydrolase (beta-lactamase superfamily II)